MTWLKDVYLDLTVLVLVVLFGVFTNQVVLEVILWVYTVLLLISKLLAFFMPGLKKRAEKTTAPDLLYHVIYLITVTIFIVIGHYYLAGAWLVIWIASAIQSSVLKNQ